MNLLKKIWKRWASFGKAIGDVVARIVMTLFYFIIAAPFGLGVRFLSDPLKLKPEEPRWEPLTTAEDTKLDNARRTF